MTLAERLEKHADALARELGGGLAEKIGQIDYLLRVFTENPRREHGQDLKERVEALVRAGEKLDLAELARAGRTLLDSLEGVMSDSQPFTVGKRFELEGAFRGLDQLGRLQRPRERGPSADTGQHRTDLIYLAGQCEFCAKELPSQLEGIGYEAACFDGLAELEAALDKDLPIAAILEEPLISSRPEAFGRLKHALDGANGGVPFISIGGDDGLEARLGAVRAGAVAYFAEPLDFNGLADTLDRLMLHTQSDPCRVLIVDDDADSAEHYSRELSGLGLTTQVVTDPLQVLTPLSEFMPDVILMDLYMPGCSGVELAKVIRQKDEFVSVPIVFFSVEQDLVRQLEAVSAGGDDFLAKGMRPEHMARSIISRARRYRTLRAYMVRDGLTGLYNHTNIKTMLEQEVMRAKRSNGRFGFAMLDLDHFKQVNDSYGHPVGDMVLKSLSRVLRQRLRKTDIVGRYGGEEFAVILLDVDGKDKAFQVVDEIRSFFGGMVHRAGEEEFTVTLSAGVAMFPEYDSARELADAADRALYGAKQAGRDRVLLAEKK